MRQRIMIAMALACGPSMLIADEPTTALDVTVQAQILELLLGLRERMRTSILFITHNLGVVAEIADRVMVMYAGRIVEKGAVVPVLKHPAMPYTRQLLRSVPRLDLPQGSGALLDTIPGSVPDPTRLPTGCTFHPRCTYAERGVCDAEVPPSKRLRRTISCAAIAGGPLRLWVPHESLQPKRTGSAKLGGDPRSLRAVAMVCGGRTFPRTRPAICARRQ
jgi:oligopeptide/dipeptide ABC transporter ATP-binding protein